MEKGEGYKKVTNDMLGLFIKNFSKMTMSLSIKGKCGGIKHE